ncbi:MAG: Holliday junction branch migration protein RuvA [Christensenellaceae bacterium]|nr:Holliday junction branch migration protein RuvA [Christensenellaceae bacterium]
MYAYIRGTTDAVFADRAIIEAGGIGYELICSGNTLKKMHQGEQAKLFAHFHLAQDAVVLYGFYTEDERAIFRKLISVSRIGPKVALNVLSALSPDDVTLAVLTDNAAAFDCVHGMGRKTAERIILELKGKVDSKPMGKSQKASSSEGSNTLRTEAIAALVALGYDGAVAGRAVASVPECDRVEDMIMAALRELSNKK